MDGVDPDLTQHGERRLGSDPREPGGREVEPACVLREAQLRVVVVPEADRSAANQLAASGGVCSRARSLTARNAVPRRDISHLYAAHATASKREASNGSQPTAWVASTIEKAPCAAAAPARPSRSATVPSDDCTALKATTSVPPSIALASWSSGAVVMSKRSCARNGHVSELKSTSGTSTREPSGMPEATRATR